MQRRIDLEVDQDDVLPVVTALITGTGVYLEPVETRPTGRWPLLRRTVVLGDVVVRLPHRDYRASVPTQTGVFGAGAGGHFAWATSLPLLDASDDVRRPPTDR